VNTLNVENLVHVSGGLIGGGSTPSGIPLYDASATREPGQNSYGETVPGGFEHYYEVLSMANAHSAAQEALTRQMNSCLHGNLLTCALDTMRALNAIEATVVPTPYTRGSQGK